MAPTSPSGATKKQTIQFAGDVQVFGEGDQHSGDEEGQEEEQEVEEVEVEEQEEMKKPEEMQQVEEVKETAEKSEDGYFVQFPEGKDPNSNSNVSSPSRTPSGTYAPERKPSNAKKSSLKKNSKPQQSAEERKRESQEKYKKQEQAYVRKLTQTMWDDYYDRAPTEHYDDIKVDSDEETIDEFGDEGVGLGGVGTSFDDEFTDLGSPYPFLYDSNNNSPGSGDFDEGLRGRLEWQAMLRSVLTGEVVRSEKNRLEQQPEFKTLMQDDDWWIGLRAKVCGRTVEEQKRVVDYARSKIGDVFDEFWNFRIQYGSGASLESTVSQVQHIIERVEKVEGLWKNLQAMRDECKPYGDLDFQKRLEALIAWLNITGAITQEFELLRQWTGNDEIDPTVKPTAKEHDDRPSLVETMLKQDDLESVFVNRLQKTMTPLIEKARDATVEYSEIYVELGLPLFHDRLNYLMQFPVKMIQEVMRLRLVYAKRLVNPTMLIIDQMITDLGRYIKLAVDITRRNDEYAAPIFDKGWVFTNHTDIDFNASILDCLSQYLELLQNKMLRDSKSTSRMYLTFKESDHLESQYTFLKDVGQTIKGADLLVAEAFSALESKMLNKLYTYWEGQMRGPEHWTPSDVERWFSTTMVNVRSFQRKLLRFYRILCANYENASEYAIQTSKLKSFVESLRQNGHFLVYTGGFEKYGIYTIANPSLANQPERIEQLLKGYCRGGDSLDHDDNSYLLNFCIQEPLVWEGEIVNLDIPYFDIDLKPGRMRLVSEGRNSDLQQTKKQLARISGGIDIFEMVVEQRSHFQKVNSELTRIRKMFFRLAVSVITSCSQFRVKCRDNQCFEKEDGCQETVHNMFKFAREFGQRGITVMDASRKGNVAMKLIMLAIEWVKFICDDCVPTDYKTFRWTVVALEFAMVMTRGVNITAINDQQYNDLRRKVAGCMTLLISHFDIMGARSKAAERKRHLELQRRNKKLNVAYKDDDELMSALREEALRKIVALEESRVDSQSVGKILDDTNTDSEFLTFLQTSFSKMSIRWQQGQFIGGGSFGSVYTAVNLDTGGVMAVKEIRLQDNSHIRRGLKSIKDEMTALEMLSHPNIVQYYGVEVHRDKVFIFMEYCEGGSLAALLEYGRIEDEQVIQVYTLQMLEGLAYLHSAGIVHRDIKPENILLDHMGVVKFVDFGGAKVIARNGRSRAGGGQQQQQQQQPTQPPNNTTKQNSARLNSMTGTPMYMSPEVITGADPGRHGSIDIWSTGCCVLEMATGRRPWANLDNDWAVMYHIAAGHLPQLPSSDQLSDDGIEFLMKCLQRDPISRQSAVELLRDSWILDISTKLIGDPAMEDGNTPSTNSSVSGASGHGDDQSYGSQSSVPSRDLSQMNLAARSITHSYTSQATAANAAAAAAAAAQAQAVFSMGGGNGGNGANNSIGPSSESGNSPSSSLVFQQSLSSGGAIPISQIQFQQQQQQQMAQQQLSPPHVQDGQFYSPMSSTVDSPRLDPERLGQLTIASLSNSSIPAMPMGQVETAPGMVAPNDATPPVLPQQQAPDANKQSEEHY